MTQHPGDLSGAEGVLLLQQFLQHSPRSSISITNPTAVVTRELHNVWDLTSHSQHPPTRPQTFPAATGELLTDTIPLNVRLLSSISLEKGLKMLFRDQTKPLIFSNLFGIGGNTWKKKCVAAKMN